MATHGKLSKSLSIASDNTNALLHVNINFSVICCDASPEYLPVGLALTRRRKEEAERGSIHSTACQLGFLFHEIIPNIPKLLRGYGLRTSEILSQPGINPQGTESDGPFQAFIGADCTSIWAAATCGPASVAVLLLACMLARAWDTKQAISIWVELVEERRRQIQQDVNDNKVVHPHSIAAAQQDIRRSELAEWDASVRSWLRRADLFMARNQTQFKLVVDNLALPYSPTGTTFDKVVAAWVGSMEVVERLMGNFPQQATDRGVLLAISSWHLYPNLIVFQKVARQIPFGDALFPNAGVLSLGLEYKGATQNVTQWSLALSHLRYYGDPVRVTSREDLGRVQISQLWLVVLGTLLRRWNVSYSNFGMAVGWFKDLHTILSSCDKAAACHQLSWLRRICAATAAEINPTASNSLIKYGWRRSTIFPKDTEMIHKPFFGLCNEHIIRAMSEERHIDSGIAYLRSIAMHLGLNVCDTVVSYTGVLTDGVTYSEWATIAPIEPGLGGWDNDSVKNEESKVIARKNVRWICVSSAEGDNHESTFLSQRCSEIKDMGEVCHIITRNFSPQLYEANQRYEYRWKHPPVIFDPDQSSGFVDFTWIQFLRGECCDRYQICVLTSKYYRLFREDRKLNGEIEASSSTTVPMEEARRHLCRTFSPDRVVEYLIASLDERHKMVGKYSYAAASIGTLESMCCSTCPFGLIINNCNRTTSWLLPLQALEIAEEIYTQFPGVTVSLRVVEKDLFHANWLPPLMKSIIANSSTAEAFTMAFRTTIADYLTDMSRAASFSCIAMFESGCFNISPEQLEDAIALCSDDSIFVARILLSDPSCRVAGTSIRHLVGNIGHSGVVFMVSPLEPRLRPNSCNPQLVRHELYDGKIIDSFSGTSLHLSFTTWKMPLEWHNTGEIDQDIFLLESVISVQDNGKWVADIDILAIEDDGADIIERFACDEACELRREEIDADLVSIDSWEEVLDPPPCTGVLRAKGNWVARLAVASVSAQQRRSNTLTIVGAESLCKCCLAELYEEPEPHWPALIIF